MSGWRYAYLLGAGLLTLLLAFAPQAYQAVCFMCEPWDKVWGLHVGVYAAAAFLGVCLIVAAAHLDRREFWWLASPPYALFGGLLTALTVLALITSLAALAR